MRSPTRGTNQRWRLSARKAQKTKCCSIMSNPVPKAHTAHGSPSNDDINRMIGWSLFSSQHSSPLRTKHRRAFDQYHTDALGLTERSHFADWSLYLRPEHSEGPDITKLSPKVPNHFFASTLALKPKLLSASRGLAF
ncbi:hypothetical protein ACE6H2_010608 [Prunus campanulata]